MRDEILAFMAEHGLSQAALARLLAPGLPSFKNTVNRWVTGSHEPEHPHILRLALAELGRRLQEGAVPQYRIIHDRCGHEVSGMFDRDIVQHRDDLCPSCHYPRPESPPVPSWRGATPGIDVDAMVRLIRQYGPYEVANMVAGAGIIKASLEDGLDLIRWTVKPASGMMVFARMGDDDKPNAPIILCVNAHEERRAEFAAQIEDPASTILLMTPYGLRDYSQIKVPDGPF